MQTEPITRANNLKLRFEAGAEYKELLIANYDMNERRRTLPQQMTFGGFTSD